MRKSECPARCAELEASGGALRPIDPFETFEGKGFYCHRQEASHLKSQSRRKRGIRARQSASTSRYEHLFPPLIL